MKAGAWGPISIAIAGLSYVLALLAMQGVFEGSSGACGDFGFRCLGNGILLLGVGCLIGTVCAIVAFSRTGPRSWLSWLGLLMNGLPLLAFVVVFFLIAMR
ncbi:MAG: hypothetical protein ABIT83_00255 [Massilia sp.]